MMRWRNTFLTSLVVVAAGALTLGAGAVMGGGVRPTGNDIVRASMPPHDPDDDRHTRDLRVVHWGGGTWLGVALEEVSGEEARGARVIRVEKDSPAERAGIRDGDIILEFDGERILGVRTLLRVVRETPEGRKVDIELERDGRRMRVEAQLEERPEGPRVFSWRGGEGSDLDFDIPDIDIKIPRLLRFSDSRPLLGVAVDTLNPQLAEFLGVQEDDGGLFIKEVFEETPAERAGLKAGDVILEAEGRRIDGVLDLREALRDNAGKTITLLIVRDRSERKVDVTLEENEDGWSEGRSLRREERRRMERALREAARTRREAVRKLRQQVLEIERLNREKRLLPHTTAARSGTPVEI